MGSVHLDVPVEREHGTVAGVEERIVLEHFDGCGDGVERTSAVTQNAGAGIDRREERTPARRAFARRSAATGAAMGNHRGTLGDALGGIPGDFPGGVSARHRSSTRGPVRPQKEAAVGKGERAPRALTKSEAPVKLPE